MTASTVTIVDYGIGNLHSVARAIEAAGGQARLVQDCAGVRDADRILLPGVGAFAACATTLEGRGLADAVREFAVTERPFLGICVGMQLLFDYSLEFGRHDGLGLIPGHVVPIPELDSHGERKVPHIGWSALKPPVDGDRSQWRGTLLEDSLPGETSFYFVHSFNCMPSDERTLLAEVDYQGFSVTAAIVKDNLTAFQCHPEKSGLAGLKVLARFLRQ